MTVWRCFIEIREGEIAQTDAQITFNTGFWAEFTGRARAWEHAAKHNSLINREDNPTGTFYPVCYDDETGQCW